MKFAQGQGWLPHRIELFERSTRLLEEAHLAKLTHRGTDSLSVHSSPHELALITLHTSRAAEVRPPICPTPVSHVTAPRPSPPSHTV